MKTTYNTSKIMRNAWYLKKVVTPTTSFGECLRKAWRNEKMNMAMARIEGRTIEESKATYRPELLQIPANYYGVRGMYYGD